MEARFRRNFGHVRVHTDPVARDSARRLGAEAYTVGSHILMSDQALAGGQARSQLLSHELAHVVQQTSGARSGLVVHEESASHEEQARRVSLDEPIAISPLHQASPIIQLKPVEGGGATPGTGEGVDLIYIIRAPDDQYTADMTAYVKTVLKGQTYKEVDNLDDIFDHLALLRAKVTSIETVDPAITVRRIRIVAHGSTTGDIKMMPRGEDKRRWVKPDEVRKYAKDPGVKQTLAQVIAPHTQIEFWGCNIGAVPKSTEALASAFQAPVTATSETLKTGFDRYVRPAEKGEVGDAVPGVKGRWVRVTATAQVDSRGKGLQRHFRRWLLARYGELVANGDIAPLKTKAQQLQYMRDLFDRSGGDIKHLLVQEKASGAQVRPGQHKRWMKHWTTVKVPAVK